MLNSVRCTLKHHKLGTFYIHLDEVWWGDEMVSYHLINAQNGNPKCSISSLL